MGDTLACLKSFQVECQIRTQRFGFFSSTIVAIAVPSDEQQDTSTLGSDFGALSPQQDVFAATGADSPQALVLQFDTGFACSLFLLESPQDVPHEEVSDASYASGFT